MSGEAPSRTIPQPPQTTNEFNDFIFSLDSTSLARLKPNAKHCYSCEFCDIQLFCKTSFSQHMLTHKSNPPRMSEKDVHLKSLESSFVCQECNLSFSQKHNFQEHCLIHNSKRSFVCEICNESFRFMRYLKRHYLRKHKLKPPFSVGEKKIVYDKINVQSLESLLINKELFSDDENAVKNTDIHELSLTHTKQNQFLCNVCNKKFISKKDYNAHCDAHSNIKPPKNKNFACEVCQQTCSTKRDLADHLKMHNYACVTYGKNFNAKKAIEIFKNKTGFKDSRIKKGKDLNAVQGNNLKVTAEGEHFNDRAFNNMSGRKEFKGKASKNKLTNTVGRNELTNKAGGNELTNKTGGNQLTNKAGKNELTNKAGCKNKPKGPKNKASGEVFICDVCSKIYTLKIAFMSHKMSHVASKPTCEVCHKQFASNKNLKLHFRRHSDVRFFFCELCNKGFKHKHHLRAHFITHTDELPFVCEVCNKGYKHKWGLKQHELVMHPKELPFVCEVCGKGFEHGRDLDTHFSTHVREPPLAENRDREIKTLAANDVPNQCVAIATYRMECSREKVEQSEKSNHETLMGINGDESCSLIEPCKTECSQPSEEENRGREIKTFTADELNQCVGVTTYKLECNQEKVKRSKESSQET